MSGLWWRRTGLLSSGAWLGVWWGLESGDACGCMGSMDDLGMTDNEQRGPDWTRDEKYKARMHTLGVCSCFLGGWQALRDWVGARAARRSSTICGFGSGYQKTFDLNMSFRPSKTTLELCPISHH